MARDRQRAKQRRDRKRRAGSDAPSGDRADTTLEHDDPLAHGSAEVDLAHAQLALGRPEEAEYVDAGDAEDFDGGSAADDELEDAADVAAGGGGRRGLTRNGGGGEDEHGGHPDRSAPSGNRVIGFLRASWRELQRVQWPDRKQVAQATGVVLGFVIIAGAYLGLADYVAQQVVKAIL